MELDMALTESVDKIMTFAEILYKCTLCTTLPSILTSKASFVSHVKTQHFNKSQNKCPVCSLTFETEEDLHAHASSTHKPDFMTTIKCEPEDNFHPITLKKGEEESCCLSSNISVLESTQMGHKINNILPFSENYHKEDIKNRNKIPEELLSFQQEYSMQNRGHSEKTESINTESHPKVNIEYGIESAPHNHLQNDMSKIQALTNHILAVNSKDKTSAYVHDFSPSFTPEFGNYTKLIREGGNIAYFCQVCNWKSQIKSHFHTHCQDKVHKEKLKHAENKSSEKACVDRPQVSKEGISKTDDGFKISEPTSNESSDPITKSLGNNENSPMKQFQEKARERQNKRKRSVLVSLRNQSSDRCGWDSSDSDQSKGSENDVVRSPGKKKYARSQILEKMSKKSENEQENKRELSSNYVDLSLNLSDSDNLNLKSKEVLDTSNFFSQERFNVSSSNLQEDANSANVPYDLYKDIHNQILWNLVGQNQQKSDSAQSSQLFYRDQNQPPPPTASSFMTDSEKFNPCKFLYRCSLCTFGCNKIQQYRKHFEIQHEQAAATAETSSYIYSEGKETWKVNKIKEFLPDLICIFPKGNVSRDLLLQKISSFGQVPEAIHWGPACNKAVREIFPDTLAQRKGKFKKTYFFGVSFIEHMQETEEVSDPEVMQYQPLRDMSQDLEKILEHLDTILEPSRDDTCSVSRDDVLSILHKRIDEPDVPYWGMQCNRAIRIIYPSVVIKRKGKFKTTVFQGVDFCEEVKHELKNLPTSAASVNKKGRPRKMYAEDFPLELYHRGMSWTDAIRTGHSESYKKYSNIHIPRPHTASSDPVRETRGWGPTVNLANDALEESRFTKSPNNPQSICQNIRGEENKIPYDENSVVNHTYHSSEFVDENLEIRQHERNDNTHGHSRCKEFMASKNWTECAFKAKYKDQDLYISVNNDDESDDIDDDSDDDADDEESLCHSIEEKDAEESVSEKYRDEESAIDVCQKHGDKEVMGSVSQKHRDNEDMGSDGQKRRDNEDMGSVSQKCRDNEDMDYVGNKIEEEKIVEGAIQNIAKNEAEEVIIDNVN